MITPSRDESCAYWVQRRLLDGGGCRCLVAAAIESVAATSGLGGKAESGFFFLPGNNQSYSGRHCVIVKILLYYFVYQQRLYFPIIIIMNIVTLYFIA